MFGLVEPTDFSSVMLTLVRQLVTRSALSGNRKESKMSLSDAETLKRFGRSAEVPQSGKEGCCHNQRNESM